MEKAGSIPSSAVHLSMDDNGLHLSLTIGQELHVHLRSSPSTGFDWHQAERDDSILVEIERVYKADSDALGSPTNLIITYHLVGTGATRLVLHYQRAWEKEVPPLQTFVVHITAAP
jgi:inhibitor of cysteine peptidase